MGLSIVIPTIPGREVELARTMEVYGELTAAPIEWVIEYDHSTCGAGWNAGALRATGDFLHLGADDLEPVTAEWWPAALQTLNAGCVPVGWVSEGDFCFGRDFARVPTCLRRWWVPVPDLHYYSDNAFTDNMAAAGHSVRVAEGYDFIHRKSMVGRDEERMGREGETYARLHQLP